MKCASGKIWFEVEGLAIADCRLGQLAPPKMGEPEGVEWFGVVRLEVESSAITGQRLVRPVFARQELAQVIMRFGIIRLEGQRPPVSLRRIIQLTLGCKDIPKIVQCFGIIRLKGQRLPVGLRRFVAFALMLKGSAQIAMESRNPAIERNGLSDQIDGRFVIAGLERDTAEKMQTTRMTRIYRQDLAVNRLSLSKLPGLMELLCDSEALGGVTRRGRRRSESYGRVT